jgi:hypothetical protein
MLVSMHMRTVAAALLLCAAMPLAAQQWWEKVTAPADGKLVLTDFKWWSKAQKLKPGEKFFVDLDKDGDPDLMVRREEKNLVVIVDDDDDMKMSDADGDKDSDCYLVDYGADGVVDRMVDYIDNNGDNVADEMEIRYYQNGELRYAWMWEDIDKDGKMWDLENYQYSAKPYKCDMLGDNLFYLNKYDAPRDAWIPFSECPFAFYDTDGDGRTEVVVRVSASPIGSDKEHDYANNYKFMWAPMEDSMRNVGNVNVRLSYSVKNADTAKRQYAADMGFTMNGEVPYRYPDQAYTNPRRRTPKTVRRIPWNKAVDVALKYPAKQTGYTWDEYDDNDRWEGIFWMWERRIIPNTGGPNLKWNKRREYDKDPSSERKVYYSGVDRRIHLFGAEEGWIEVGQIRGSAKIGEVRMLDTDGNGYFDTWEYDLDNDGVPERTTTVRDEKARMLRLDQKELHDFYTREVLPAAIAENEKLIAALKALAEDEQAGVFLALAKDCDSRERQRYLLDLAREKLFAKALNELYRRSKAQEANSNMSNSRSPQHLENQKRSSAWWEFSRGIQDFRDSYGAGDYARAAQLLERLVAAK